MEKQKILLVDNRQDFCETLQEFLELKGYIVKTVADAGGAKALLAAEHFALAIIDKCLINDDDETDESGLRLAKQLPAALPKIMLTAHPDYQSVREMLGPGPDGKPVAIGYVAKEEGLEALLTSVRLALAQFSPTFERNLLQAFQAPALPALRERLLDLGPQQAVTLMQAASVKTMSDLASLRVEARHQATHLHRFGLMAKYTALALLTAACVMLLRGATDAGVVTAIVGALAEGFDFLCGKQEKQAHKRADELHDEIRETEQNTSLMVLCETLEHSQDRDAYRKKALDHILSRRSD